jgi:farnesyl diphosphate synthase
MSEIKNAIEFYKQRIRKVLWDILAQYESKSDLISLRLLEAMRYSLLASSAKRLRPTLVYAIGEALGASLSSLDTSAAAIEFMHTYSLIHDDLPALDNDEFRRDQRACHKAFDEATAILAGNAMQLLACEILIDSANALKPTQRLKCLQILTEESGMNGMIKGQMLDLYQLNDTKDLNLLENVYRLKTCALIKSSLFLGAMTADCQDTFIFDTLASFADKIGLAFQIQDDILDVEVDKKIEASKATFPSLIGLEKSKEKVKRLYEASIDLLQSLPCQVKLLEAMAKVMVFRTY